MTSQQILTKYFAFFKKHGHRQIQNVSLLPEGDSTLLFVNSGMFPLVPYLSGEPHPMGKRLVNVQRALRFEDIDEVGDNRHTTCFHMIGNWSLGDYFKKEQLPWIYTFFIEELGFNPKKLYASVFAGDQYAPKDTESIAIIKNIFKKYGVEARENERIFAYGKADNWWQRGEAVGELGGPDSEVFYYIGQGDGLGKNPAQNQNEFLEIGNSVFMQYRKTKDGWEELPQKNVDFGGGLERIALVAQNKTDIFQTDGFWPIIRSLENLSGKNYLATQEVSRTMRIIADHSRAVVLLVMDGVIPSNKDQGYVLRRYLRRIIRLKKTLNLGKEANQTIIKEVIQTLSWLYPELIEKRQSIEAVFAEEEEKFAATLDRAGKKVRHILKFFKDDIENLARATFDLYQSTGFPPEMVLEEAQEQNITINSQEFKDAYQKIFQKHQQISRKGAEKRFKGGLADHSQEVIKYHTTTHLLHAALRQVLGEHVIQHGSNITRERLRFDFSHPKPLTDSEIRVIEKVVNQTIQKELPVNFVILPRQQAEKSGALHFFKEKYGDRVKVYYIGNSLQTAFSKEFCGGPHVKNLKELSATFTIYKQEAVGKGIRRVYAKFKP